MLAWSATSTGVRNSIERAGGIFCKTRKAKYEINFPLIELEIPQDSPNLQFIEDYWFWNCR
jgi:hypothetical protein